MYLSNDKNTVIPISAVLAIKQSGATIGTRYSPKLEIASILIDGNPRITREHRQKSKSHTPRPKIMSYEFESSLNYSHTLESGIDVGHGLNTLLY